MAARLNAICMELLQCCFTTKRQKRFATPSKITEEEEEEVMFQPTHFLYPIGSMGLVYSPTFTIEINQM